MNSLTAFPQKVNYNVPKKVILPFSFLKIFRVMIIVIIQS